MAPVAAVPATKTIFHGLFVAATVAPVAIAARVTTVPDPHPLMVHSLTLNVSVGDWAIPIVNIPDPPKSVC